MSIFNIRKSGFTKGIVKFVDTKNIDSGYNISFVNGINTNKNGKHVDYLIDLLFDKFQKLVPDFTKKLLNDYITIIFKTSIINPSFNSQSKEQLMTPSSKFGFDCNIPDSFWNQVKQTAHPLWKNIPDNSRFYFVHSYYAQVKNSSHIAGTSDYPNAFACALMKDNVFAVQFHPEKSQHVGLQLLANFLIWDILSV